MLVSASRRAARARRAPERSTPSRRPDAPRGARSMARYLRMGRFLQGRSHGAALSRRQPGCTRVGPASTTPRTVHALPGRSGARSRKTSTKAATALGCGQHLFRSPASDALAQTDRASLSFRAPLRMERKALVRPATPSDAGRVRGAGAPKMAAAIPPPLLCNGGRGRGRPVLRPKHRSLIIDCSPSIRGHDLV